LQIAYQASETSVTDNKRPAAREHIAKALESLDPDVINTFVKEALAAEKTVWGTCDGCRKKFPVDVPDWNARANVVDKLLTQGYGRPRTEEEESGKGFVLRRSLVFPEANYEHILALVQEHGIGSLHPHPDGGVEVVTSAETAATEPDRAA
jgi:hypothetical protein